MKTFFQLVFAGLIINACFQGASSYWNFYRLEEEVREEILHGRQTTFSQLHMRVTEMAADRGLNVEYEDVDVSHRQAPQDIDVHFSYVDEIAFIPRFFIYPWPYESTVGTHRLRALIVDEQSGR
jgi:hypothetical protein